MQKPEFAAWPGLLAGIMVTFVGIGLARFAYTPLIPLLVQAQWFSATEAVYLGAANLLGYLLGALTAHRLTQWISTQAVVLGSLAAVVLSFWLCALPNDFAWFFAWRLIAGVSGALLMVLVPSVVLATTPPERRAMVGTLVFSGVGLGALLAATVIPLVMARGLGLTWWLLGALSVLGGGFCLLGVRRLCVCQAPRKNANFSSRDGRRRVASPASLPSSPTSLTKSWLPWSGVALVIMAHALDGIGFIPHTVFWVDFLARENGLESAMPLFVVGSSLLWVGMLLVLASHRYAANRLAGSP